MKLHKDKQVVRPDYTRFTTLCGRMNRRSTDGMNIADTDADVTCKFCLRLMAPAAPQPQPDYESMIMVGG